MARYAQRPENALKRANEFIDVGKPARALDTLQEVFRNKKWAYNWSESVLEPIMFKYLDLCVELKKSHIAKEGLFQYRNMFQLVNVGSLENVIRGYLRMAEERTEAAQQQCTQAVIVIDDLDNLATPESILMSAVCGEDAQDRSERTILMPWVKFLWESYCQCLELLRTNAHVETLYHDIARMVFQFCLKYNRKTEFRKLCDKLRKHLEDICKLSVQTTNVSINKPETQQLNLETRLFQLDSAIQMELWQEAYKAIEDIHGLMNMSKKQPLPKTMANYYQKLSMVFWKAGNQLFHAASLLKLFQLSREMKKNITSEELQRMACRVLLSTLAIPLPSAHPEFDRFIETDKSPLEKAQRLSVLLGLSQPPTREALLRDIVRMNVVQLASPQLQQLYTWLEVEFDPLNLCSRVLTVIEGLTADESNVVLQQYVPALQDVTLVRLVRQVSQVYQSIEFARLIQLARFTTDFHLERLLVDCVRHNDMQIRIDHAKRSIHFGMDLSESQREDKPEGPTLQSMPSEQVRNQLISMATVLHQAIAAINPHRKKADRDKLRAQMVQNYHENKVKEHQRVLQRHKIIEDRKEYIERLNTVREEEELRRQEEILRQQQLAEQRRLEQEREERERKRQANERQQIKDRNLKEKMQKISLTTHGQRVLKKLDEEEMKKMDAEQIAAREAEELLKERREFQAKLKSQEKKIDYFERAKRIEEIPLIQKSLEEKQVQDRKFWEEQEANRIAQAVAERALAVAQQKRLLSMVDEKNAFMEILRSSRRHVHEGKLKEFNVMLDAERSKRLALRVQQRKEERRKEWLRQKAEEARRVEEALRKAQEEEKRLEHEKKLQADREHQEMLERAAVKARAREEEIERKLAASRENSRENDTREKEKDRGVSSWRRGEPRMDREGKPERKEAEWRNNISPVTVGDKLAASEASTARSTSSDRSSELTTTPSTMSAEPSPRKEEAWRGTRGASDRKEPVSEGTWRRAGDDRMVDRDIRKDGDRDSGRFERRDDRYRDIRERRGDREDRDRRGERDDRDRRGERDDRDRRGERDDRDRRGERDDRDRRGERDDRERRGERDDRERRGERGDREDRDRRGERDDRDRRGERDGGDRRGDRDERDRRDDGRFERDSDRRFERRQPLEERNRRDRDGGRDWRMDCETQNDRSGGGGGGGRPDEDGRPVRRGLDRGAQLRNNDRERQSPRSTESGDWRSAKAQERDMPVRRGEGPQARTTPRIEKAQDNAQTDDNEWHPVKRR